MKNVEQKIYEALDTPMFGCADINPKYCETCRYSKGEPPFADHWQKANCQIYTREIGLKPDEVYHDGEPCEHYKPMRK